MKHCSITFFPEGQTITVHQGATLLEAAGLAGIILHSPCGGSGTCGKCRVLIGPEKREQLACQYRVEGDLEVTIPRESRYFQQQILEHGIEREIHVTPIICKYFFNQAPSSLEQLKSTLSQLLSSPVEIHSDSAIQKEITGGQDGATAVLSFSQDNYHVLCMEFGDTRDSLYGVALDIGTTTLVARLLDLHSGIVKQTVSSANPQIRYGDDVIRRIHHGQTETGLSQLHHDLVQCLNEMIAALCKKEKISPEQVYEIAAVGNTTMHHLLHQYPVSQLGQAPYQAYSTAAEDRNARQAGLLIHPQGRLYTVENIAGFVGSDTVAAALAAGMDTTDEISLLVDIGTNGELVLGTRECLVSASCAAGPALEGARIFHGSRAVRGSIQRVIAEKEEIVLDVIGSVPPTTICGSGLIDAVAVMLDLGIILTNGAFCGPETLKDLLPPALLKRLIQVDKQPAFVLAWKGGSRQPSVYLTQKDIREVQLAKAAIQTGILLLLKKLNLIKDEIQHLYLAGAFGNYIQKHSAVRMGLLPDIAENKIQFIGNAASVGAQMVLVSRRYRKIASQLADQIQYIEIAKEAEFQSVFSSCLFFPEPD